MGLERAKLTVCWGLKSSMGMKMATLREAWRMHYGMEMMQTGTLTGAWRLWRWMEVRQTGTLTGA